MTVTYTENADACTVELTVDGRVTREEFDALAPRMEAFIASCGSIRLIEVIRKLDGFDGSLLWEGLKLDFRVIPHISHCAVVSDIGWLSPVSKAAGALTSTKLRTFPLADLEAARNWVADPNAA